MSSIIMVCKFDIMENSVFVVIVFFHIYINAPQYDNNLFSFTLLSCLK